ncbi:MAG: hypothetical protein R8M11_10260 [Gallionella sp.]
MVDEEGARAAVLNADPQTFKTDRAALEAKICSLGENVQQSLSVGHDFMFADVPLFISSEQLAQMQAVIAAVERVVHLPGWLDSPENGGATKGVFYGYDFHLNAQGAQLIEINTNAGGGLLNNMLVESQSGVNFPGTTTSEDNLEAHFLEMFRNEYRQVHGDAPLKSIAIVDEHPESQYFYPEFLLAQRMFERDGITAFIADPSELHSGDDGLYIGDKKIDLIYNRLTDFSLQHHVELRQAYESGFAVVTPAPTHYVRYADKRNLARLSDTDVLHDVGASEADIAALQAGVPHTFLVRLGMDDEIWAKRKQLFFKPNTGYGSKGTFRGKNVTKRVFKEIMESDYVAQQLAVPGERMVCTSDGEEKLLKCDVRCYVYDGAIQLICARLYQGQTTNMRTPGGGFALVRVK